MSRISFVIKKRYGPGEASDAARTERGKCFSVMVNLGLYKLLLQTGLFLRGITGLKLYYIDRIILKLSELKLHVKPS